METVKKVSKAIAGGVATVVVAWLAKENVVIEGGEVATVVEYALAAVIGLVVVYFAPKNTE